MSGSSTLRLTVATMAVSRILADTPSHILHTGAKMPMIGLGTWKAEPGVVGASVRAALELGYRHLDCACDYGNEREVGEAIRSAIADGICTREDLWVTTKLWNTFHKKEHVEQALRRQLDDLGLEYVDLYLIHFPIALKFVPFEERYPPEWKFDPKFDQWPTPEENAPLHETWAELERLVDLGLARHIGISNFQPNLVMDMLNYCRIPPAVNQLELHPYLTQDRVLEFHRHRDISVTAYSPLGSGSYTSISLDKGQGIGVLNEPVIAELAKKYDKTPAQIILRWGIQRGCSVIPKSTNRDRLAENINILDFELDDVEMRRISDLNCNCRYNDPALYANLPIFD